MGIKLIVILSQSGLSVMLASKSIVFMFEENIAKRHDVMTLLIYVLRQGFFLRKMLGTQYGPIGTQFLLF